MPGVEHPSILMTVQNLASTQRASQVEIWVRCYGLIQDVVDLYEKVQARTRKFTEVLEMRINKIWGSVDLIARFKCTDIDDHICLSVTQLEEDFALLCFQLIIDYESQGACYRCEVTKKMGDEGWSPMISSRTDI